MKQSGIYQIQSKIKPERIYIGSAIDIHSRIQKHMSELKRGKHGNSRLQNHANKYGIDDLVVKIIEPCLLGFLLVREQYYIDTLNPYFNICKVAGNTTGIKFSDEAKKKISDAHRGKKGHRPSPEGIERIRQAHKGRIFSDETREKMRKAWRPKGTEYKKGEKQPPEIRLKRGMTLKARYPHGVHNAEQAKLIGLKNRGMKMPESHTLRLIERNKNKIWTPEMRLKSSTRFKGNKYCQGRIMSEESKQKNRESHLGKKASESARLKMSLVRKGRKFSEDHRLKISIALKKRFEGMKNKKVA